MRGKISCSDKFHLLDNVKVSSFKTSNWFRIIGGAGGDGVSPTPPSLSGQSHQFPCKEKECVQA